jgi:methionyl-tRNA formyltransferase
MRILFMGASALGFDCCEAIIKAGHNVVGAFTIPQEFQIKYRDQESKSKVSNYLFKDFNYFHSEYNLPVVFVEGKMSSYTDQAAALAPDLILAIGWYYMIPEAMLKLAAKGAIGIHGSLLPKYRGNAPFVWAMINGEKETGVSLFYFEKGVDEGDIIAQKKIPIEESDNISHVLEKAKTASIDILLQYLPLLADGKAPKIAQDHSLATLYPKRTPEDGLIDWSWDKMRIKNFIRAQTKPYPGAFTIVNDKKVIIWDADIIEL